MSAFATKTFDWKNPDYEAVMQDRLRRLAWLRSDPSTKDQKVAQLKAYYAESPADFIEDWGVTFDPRNLDIRREPLMPFIMFPKQREWISWVVDLWRGRRDGICDKSRDGGVSWLAISLANAICLHLSGAVIGFGSRKEEYVDKLAEPKSLFWKSRLFLRELPIEFRGGWDENRHAPHMRIVFPETGSVITGEAGKNIGRGDRTTLYFVDESGHLDQPQQVDMALSATTNCRIEISSANGMNYFGQRRHSGKVPVFTLHWRDDPRKDEAWYKAECAKRDPVVIAQEIDIDYQASVTGVLIPRAWALAAVDACRKLGIKPTGTKSAGLDVADEGPDVNALCAGHGIEVQYVSEWSGKGDDIFGTVENAFDECDRLGIRTMRYDADGLGAGVRGDARVINAKRKAGGLHEIAVRPHRGSAAVVDPEKQDVEGRKNEDFFANRKAQMGWRLRDRFRKTHLWVTEGKPCDIDDIVSIPSELADGRPFPLLTKLLAQLSQPTWRTNDVGKVLINKKPDGTPSPNLYDALVIYFAQGEAEPLQITPELLAAAAARRGQRARR